MVGIVAGTSLGLGNTSFNWANGRAVLDAPLFGGDGTRIFVNAKTGNLVIQRVDDELDSSGVDVSVLRTYNSLGKVSGFVVGDGDDYWRNGLTSVLGSGQAYLSTSGTPIVRTDVDGSKESYVYDSASGKYLRKEGQGAYDSLSYDSGTTVFTWTSGSDPLLSKTYTNYGRLISASRGRGAVVNYSYNEYAQLTDVTVSYALADGVAGILSESIHLTYDPLSTRLIGESLVQQSRDAAGVLSSTTLTSTVYAYDTSGRLRTVSVDLTPSNANDSVTYVTTYDYQGSTNLVSQISESDGSAIRFSYDTSKRVATFSQQISANTWRTSTVTYDIASGSGSGSGATTATTVTDANGNTESVGFNAAGAPIQFSGHGVSAGYGYGADGNITSASLNGASTSFTLDANGNTVAARDAAGDLVSRSFDSRNNLVSQTTYTGTSAGTSATGIPAGAQTTHYVYDASNQLSFIIDAQGRVSQVTSNAAGLVASRVSYTGGVYTGGVSGAAYDYASVASWASAQDLSKSQRSESSYDIRGKLLSQTVYARVSAAGQGVADGSQSTTRYVYSPAGLLLQIIAPNQSGLSGQSGQSDPVVTNFSYDGLNRPLSITVRSGAIVGGFAANAIVNKGQISGLDALQNVAQNVVYSGIGAVGGRRQGASSARVEDSSAAPANMRTTVVYEATTAAYRAATEIRSQAPGTRLLPIGALAGTGTMGDLSPDLSEQRVVFVGHNDPENQQLAARFLNAYQANGGGSPAAFDLMTCNSVDLAQRLSEAFPDAVVRAPDGDVTYGPNGLFATDPNTNIFTYANGSTVSVQPLGRLDQSGLFEAFMMRGEEDVLTAQEVSTSVATLSVVGNNNIINIINSSAPEFSGTLQELNETRAKLEITNNRLADANRNIEGLVEQLTIAQEEIIARIDKSSQLSRRFNASHQMMRSQQAKIYDIESDISKLNILASDRNSRIFDLENRPPELDIEAARSKIKIEIDRLKSQIAPDSDVTPRHGWWRGNWPIKAERTRGYTAAELKLAKTLAKLTASMPPTSAAMQAKPPRTICEIPFQIAKGTVMGLGELITFGQFGDTFSIMSNHYNNAADTRPKFSKGVESIVLGGSNLTYNIGSTLLIEPLTFIASAFIGRNPAHELLERHFAGAYQSDQAYSQRELALKGRTNRFKDALWSRVSQKNIWKEFIWRSMSRGLMLQAAQGTYVQNNWTYEGLTDLRHFNPALSPNFIAGTMMVGFANETLVMLYNATGAAYSKNTANIAAQGAAFSHGLVPYLQMIMLTAIYGIYSQPKSLDGYHLSYAPTPPTSVPTFAPTFMTTFPPT